MSSRCKSHPVGVACIPVHIPYVLYTLYVVFYVHGQLLIVYP